MESFPFDESLMHPKCLASSIITQRKKFLTPQTVLLTRNSVTVIWQQEFLCVSQASFHRFLQCNPTRSDA